MASIAGTRRRPGRLRGTLDSQNSQWGMDLEHWWLGRQ